MKLIKLIFTLIIVAVIGGFAYVATTDVPIEQSEISKTISNDRFFDAK